jgi:hypothetical protein
MAAAIPAPKPEFVQQEAVALAQQPVPAAAAAPAVAESGTPQATLYNDYFIPPKPVEAGQTGTASAAARAGSGLAATRPASATAPGFNLRPPVPPSQQPGKRRTPSLFERFTSPLWNGGAEDQGKADEGRGETGSAGSAGGAGGLRAPGRPTQGSLNIDATVSEGTESELDIPAFLRRQAN